MRQEQWWRRRPTGPGTGSVNLNLDFVEQRCSFPLTAQILEVVGTLKCEELSPPITSESPSAPLVRARAPRSSASGHRCHNRLGAAGPGCLALLLRFHGLLVSPGQDLLKRLPSQAPESRRLLPRLHLEGVCLWAATRAFQS